MAQALLESGFWAGVCFQSEQTAKRTLKAFLYRRGWRYVNIHSIHTLIEECGQVDAEFRQFQSYGGFLDRFYLSTRYPDAVPAPAVPFESFTESEARRALGYADAMVEAVRVGVQPQ